MLNTINDDIWVAKRSKHILGIDFGLTMTVVRLDDGSLFIHNPIELDDELIRGLDALGQVKHVVTPNCMYHKHIEHFMELFPEATFYHPIGLEEKMGSRLEGILSKKPIESIDVHDWEEHLDIINIKGMPFLNESLFYHKRTKTLICGELIYTLPEQKGTLAQLVLKFLGLQGEGLQINRFVRYLIRNEKEYNQSVLSLKNHMIHRVVTGHGISLPVSSEAIVPALLTTI